jgi:tRNA pseudouridine55 synthase
MDGLLLVDKPAGWTSFDVVAKLRGLIRAETGQKIKIGHTGTLDPMATGLLVLVLGSYTKRAGEFSKLDKTYEAELTLGRVSTTGDGEGELTQKSTHQPTLEEIQKVLNKFVGEINQVPPAFSAIKVGGQRAYKLARAGKKVVIEPRQVKIYSITNLKYDYPKLRFVTEVSSGTYIRTLAEDIGQKLSTGAYLSDLRRTEVGKFDVKDARQLGKLNFQTLESHLIQALPKG